jgi:probable HAF family extracellular repeat protein
MLASTVRGFAVPVSAYRVQIPVMRALIRIIALTIVLAQSVFSQSLIQIGTIGGSSSHGLDINEAGQIVGTAPISSNQFSRAVIYHDGAIQELPTLGGDQSWANAINSSGWVTGGSAITGGSERHAFLYSLGQMEDLGTLGGTLSYGNDVNDTGTVVGSSWLAGDKDMHAFLYSGGSMVGLGTLGGVSTFGTTYSSAEAINNFGQVTGGTWDQQLRLRAFIFSGGTMRDIGTLGGQMSYGRDINDLGQVTGLSSTLTATHAFIYGNGVMTDLGTLGGLSEGMAINNLGQAVGYSQIPGVGARAFLYSDGVMIDLNKQYVGLMSYGGSAGFTNLSFAESISDNGLITGSGTYFDGQRSYSQRGFLLDTRGEIDYSIPPLADSGNTLVFAMWSLAAVVFFYRRRGNPSDPRGN